MVDITWCFMWLFRLSSRLNWLNAILMDEFLTPHIVPEFMHCIDCEKRNFVLCTIDGFSDKGISESIPMFSLELSTSSCDDRNPLAVAGRDRGRPDAVRCCCGYLALCWDARLLLKDCVLPWPTLLEKLPFEVLREDAEGGRDDMDEEKEFVRLNVFCMESSSQYSTLTKWWYQQFLKFALGSRANSD